DEVSSAHESPLVEISARQAELLEHRTQESLADLLRAVLHYRQPVAVVEGAVTASSALGREGHVDTTAASEAPDLADELSAGH
ncbi:MAG TPA: hypothetical protein VFS60_01155, partial [Thermoanaerobaculia bacterium]|nr:hypothetical protein [Thermoanaerobaculia bacterium]